MKSLAFNFTVSTALIFLFAQNTRAINVDTVPIGNPGNPADTRYLDSAHPKGVGSVPYAFRIGKTEVTNAQYMAFLNAVAKSDPYELYGLHRLDNAILRNGSDGSYTYELQPTSGLNGEYTYGDKPVVYVSWLDAARFANWLHNGQPVGAQDATTTEDGAYALNGATEETALTVVTRKAGARWWIPSDDEWYKAAYHKNDGVTANYWDYPTRTNIQPNNNAPSQDTGNSVNYYQFDGDESGCATGNCFYPLTPVGAYTLSSSPYATFDQGGNVREWDEGLVIGQSNDPFRLLRGGSWSNLFSVNAADPFAALASYESNDWGFRVATLAIPEPRTVFLLILGISSVIGCRAMYSSKQ